MKRKRRPSLKAAIRAYVDARYEFMMEQEFARKDWLMRLAGIAKPPLPSFDTPVWWA